MSIKSHARWRNMLVTVTTLSAIATTAHADGPFSYTGKGGERDVLFVPYHDIAAGHTETLTFVLHTGNALSYPTHFAIGARGVSARTGMPHGRGIALGHMEGITNCTSGPAVAVEDFDGGYLSPSAPGVLANTAICYPFANNATYRIIMNVTDTDVSFSISERTGNDGSGASWDEIISGGCLASGQSCPVHPAIDGNAGDAFVLSAASAPWAPSSWTWSASQVYVTNN